MNAGAYHTSDLSHQVDQASESEGASFRYVLNNICTCGTIPEFGNEFAGFSEDNFWHLKE
jgi:hypothetical protein